MRIEDCHIFANRHAFCVGRKISGDQYLWFAARIKILENRFRGTAIRIDDPEKISVEWNAIGRVTRRRPILRAEGEEHFLEFRTSGFPNIPQGFFSTAFLGNQSMAMDSFAGVLHCNAGVALANRVGSFWLGTTFVQKASLNAVRRKFRGEGPVSFGVLARSFF